MKLVEYTNYKNIVIEFLDSYKHRVSSSYTEFKDGTIKNPYYPSYFGAGYRGCGEYQMYDKRYTLKVTQCWCDMLDRCYGKTHKNKYKTYKDCFVCNDWLNFQNFAKWYYSEKYECDELLNLDKDIMFNGNNLYSPETCLLVPQSINKHAICGSGCSWRKRSKKWEAYVIEDKKQRWLGEFDEKETAHIVFLEEKNKYWQNKIDSWKDKLPEKVFDACKKKVFI